MRNWLLSILCVPAVLFGDIREVQKISAIEQVLEPRTLVVVDLDNTLFTTPQMVGSSQWGWHLRTQLLEAGAEPDEVGREVLQRLIAINGLSRVVPVENSTCRFIEHLQEENVAVVGVTSRPPESVEVTERQLAKLGLRLYATAPVAGECTYDNGSLLRGGVLYLAPGFDKGLALSEMFYRGRYVPKKIVMLDDQEIYLRQVEQTAKDWGIRFEGLRYGACDKWVETFDPEIADLQWEVFQRLLSDKEAALILQGRAG